MDVEDRERVHEPVGPRPRPGVGERVEIGGDRPARHEHSLGRSGRPRRVDDEGDGLWILRGVGQRSPLRHIDVQPTHTGQRPVPVVGGSADQRLRPRVRDDVRELPRAELGVERHRLDPRLDRGQRRNARLQAVLGPERDALQTTQPARERAAHPRQLGVAVGRAADRERGRVGQLAQSGQLHRPCCTSARPSARFDPWARSPPPWSAPTPSPSG